MKSRATRADLDTIFDGREVIIPSEFIAFFLRKYNMTYEDARELIWVGIDEGVIRLDSLLRVQRICLPGI